jgi:hypothetical protein
MLLLPDTVKYNQSAMTTIMHTPNTGHGNHVSYRSLAGLRLVPGWSTELDHVQRQPLLAVVGEDLQPGHLPVGKDWRHDLEVGLPQLGPGPYFLQCRY